MGHRPMATRLATGGFLGCGEGAGGDGEGVGGVGLGGVEGAGVFGEIWGESGDIRLDAFDDATGQLITPVGVVMGVVLEFLRLAGIGVGGVMDEGVCGFVRAKS